MSNFTPAEKLRAIEREIKYRRWVFPKRVAEGKMSKDLADRELSIFEAIRVDYLKAQGEWVKGI